MRLSDEYKKKIEGEVKSMVLKYFNGDQTKTEQWFSLDNLNFGGVSPNRLLQLERHDKLKAFVKQAMSHGFNQPEKGQS